MRSVLLRIHLASDKELQWAQDKVIEHHYLHAPVDNRCRPIAYIVTLQQERVGCLIFGRPESTACYPWYGSVHDVQTGRAHLSRWELINLARVWLDPMVQRGGASYIANAATYVIAQALSRVVVDYLILNPPIFLEEPWQLRECLSYCDTQFHRGTLYRAANFSLVRENRRGIQTYVRPLRHLTHQEQALITRLTEQHPRSRRYRAQRSVAHVQQTTFDLLQPIDDE